MGLCFYRSDFLFGFFCSGFFVFVPRFLSTGNAMEFGWFFSLKEVVLWFDFSVFVVRSLCLCVVLCFFSWFDFFVLVLCCVFFRGSIFLYSCRVVPVLVSCRVFFRGFISLSLCHIVPVPV